MRKAFVVAILLLTTSCLADSFRIEGTITSPFTGAVGGSFAGWMEINTRTGAIVNWYIAMPYLPPQPCEPEPCERLAMNAYIFTPSSSTAYFFYGEGHVDSIDKFNDFVFGIPSKTLKGFTGSAFSGGYGDNRSRVGGVWIASGTITTPEPSSLLLMGSGLAGMLAFRRKAIWARIRGG